jgi:hypothetical protein
VSHPALGGVLPETAVWTRPWRDVQVLLVRTGADGDVLLEVRVRPVVWAVWGGALLLALGPLVVLAGGYRARTAARMLVPPSSAPGCSHAHASQSSSDAHQSG